MTRLPRFRRPYWVGCLVPKCTTGVRDIVWKQRAAFTGSSFHSLSPGPPRGTAPQDSSSQPAVNKSLLEILKMVLRTTNGKLNIQNLNLSFRKEDRSFSGYLPPPKVTKLHFRSVHVQQATSGHWSMVRKHSYDLCCACGLHYTVFFFFGFVLFAVTEGRKTK